MLREELPPSEPPWLVARVLQRVRGQLALRDAIDLVTAGLVRVAMGGWLPHGREERPPPPPAEPSDDREA